MVNDTLGHGAGDQLLVEVARLLSTAVRASDTVARTGGDEFLLLLSGINEAADAGLIATKIVSGFDNPISIVGTEVHTSMSIGISVYPADGADADSLVAHADEAMYFAKQRGRNGFQFFSPGMNVFSRERLNFESDLRRALPQKQFELHYQPKMDVATDRVNSVEALLRWRNPSRGVIGPLEFMPIAQEAGLMSSISEWVLNEACRQAREWQVAGLPFVRIAVNISPIQFRQSRFLESVRTALSEHHLEPRFLEIELTETAIMDQAESSVTILEELSRMGVLVSIDDFGAGYSSMSYLRRLPIDKLKIDQSLIQDLTTHSDATSIVTAIISLAHSLRLKVVAEGVETKEQLQELRALGCDQYQGFYRSAAVPPGEIERLLTARSESTDLQDQPRLTDTQRKLAALERS